MLVVRDRHQCRPTPEGEIFLPYARSLLTVAERAQAAVRERVLTIGASSNVGIYLLQPHVKAFRANGGADVRVDLRIGTNPDVADKLERHEVDVAVMEWWDGRPGFGAAAGRHLNETSSYQNDEDDANTIRACQGRADRVCGGCLGT